MSMKSHSYGLRFPFLVGTQDNPEVQAAINNFRKALLSGEQGLFLDSGGLFINPPTEDGAVDGTAVFDAVRKLLGEVWVTTRNLLPRKSPRNLDCSCLQSFVDTQFTRTGIQAIVQWHKWSLWYCTPQVVQKIAGDQFCLRSERYDLRFQRCQTGFEILTISSRSEGGNFHGFCSSIQLQWKSNSPGEKRSVDQLKRCLPENALSILGLDVQFVTEGLGVAPVLSGGWCAHPTTVSHCSVAWVEPEPTRL